MANTAQANPEAESREAEGEAEAGASAKGGKKKLIIIVAAALLLVGGGAGAFFAGLLDPLLGKTQEAPPPEQTAPAQPAAPKFVDLPDIIVSVDTGDRRPMYLKLRISLEVGDSDVETRIQDRLPRILDYCQVFLRELQVDDLRGSSGMLRLREELSRRINQAIQPSRINDVLITEIFIQ